jgi:hypothetical protein
MWGSEYGRIDKATLGSGPGFSQKRFAASRKRCRALSFLSCRRDSTCIAARSSAFGGPYFFGAVETFSDSWQRHLVAQLAKVFQVDSVSFSPFGLNLKADGVALGLLTYDYPLQEPTVQLEKIELASILDIGLLKIDAVAGRSTRKDFYDLYFVAQEIPLGDLFERGKHRFSLSRQSKENLLFSLIDFDVAETFPEPLLLAQVSWVGVKDFFQREVRQLSHVWLD